MPFFGLIGYPLTHSYSSVYFTKKFETEGRAGFVYTLFPIERIAELNALLNHHPDLDGFNVTIPYKKAIIPYLQEMDEEAREAGAVNTVFIRKEPDRRILKGYNTDAGGFRTSLISFIGEKKLNALIFGTGGAALAAAYVMRTLRLSYQMVSRKKGQPEHLTYRDIDQRILDSHQLLINATPLGMFPETQTFPDIPYNLLNESHYLFDMVYNPIKTVFLRKGEERGCQIQNGLQMLHLQAELSFDIWMKGLSEW